MFSFEVLKQLGDTRLTRLTTPHGVVEGPFFQFVATNAAVRGLVYSEDLEKLGVQIVLANTYHLHVRPGEEVVAEAGGLHGFMQWDGPITTDSGGYQVFSLGKQLKLDADGVTFRSPTDGSEHRLTPETTMQIEHALGADIIMPLDIATPFDASRDDVEQAVAQTALWAKRCLTEHKKLLSGSPSASPMSRSTDGDQSDNSISCVTADEQRALYGIVQGGLFPDLRQVAAEELREMDFFGYSVGGELRDATGSRMEEGVKMTTPHLPADKPRYLMGAGSPADIVRAVRAGIDQFDCVLPIRDARHGRIYRDLDVIELERCLRDPERPVDPAALHSVMNITRSSHARDWSVFSPDNPAVVKPYTVGYVHHLFRSEAPSGFRLAVLHNILFYRTLMSEIRRIVAES